MPQPQQKTQKQPLLKGRAGGVIGVAAAALIVVFITGAINARFALGEKPNQRPPLTVAATTYKTQDHYLRPVSYLGLVSAGRKADLGFEVAGTVAELPWREGSPVAAGEVIAKLDDAALQASFNATAADLAQAKSELELAKLNASRQQDLRATGAVSKQAYDETRLSAQALGSRVDAVSARLRSIEIQLEKSQLRAPYAGVIADRYIHQGTVVNPGTKVVRFIETAGREANIGIAVSKAAEMELGKNYRLKLRGQHFESPLLSIRPDVDPVTRVITAVFSLPENIQAIDGEPVTLELSEEVPTQGGWLPISALLEGSRGLWTVLKIVASDEGTRTLREAVEVIEIQGNRVYVHGTLNNGSRVVASGAHRISPGSLISVAAGQ